MKLYTYFRSSAAFRVRIALNLKGLKPEQMFVHLRRHEQSSPSYQGINPQGLVPTLVHNGNTIGQSLAIVEYLDEIVPDPPLLPSNAIDRARVRELACIVACEIHPLGNLRVREYLRNTMGQPAEAITDWSRHWIALGLAAFEAMVAGHPKTGRFCHGDKPTLADIFLIPQVTNARRENLDLRPYPTLMRIEEAALALPAFSDALPKNQPDAE